MIIGGGLAVLLYLSFARALRIEELTSGDQFRNDQRAADERPTDVSSR